MVDNFIKILVKSNILRMVIYIKSIFNLWTRDRPAWHNKTLASARAKVLQIIDRIRGISFCFALYYAFMNFLTFINIV